MKRNWYLNLVAAGVLAASLAIANQSHAALLTMFDPVGSQDSDAADLPPALNLVSITVTPLHNGNGVHGGNVNVRPVLAGSDAFNPLTNHYIEFTVAPANLGEAIQLTTIEYDYLSYIIGSTFKVSLLTSADGFTTPVETKIVAGGTRGLMTFTANSVPATYGPLTIRFYLYETVNGMSLGGPPYDSIDWADIVSTTADTNAVGLSVYGDVIAPVATQSSTWGKVKSLYR